MKVIKKNIKDIAVRNILIHGAYINASRHLPHLLGGLKPIYHYLIVEMLTRPAEKKVKSANLLGAVGGKYSPHNTDTANGVIALLVNAGIFDGEGNFGYKSPVNTFNEGPAAPRYTDLYMNKDWRKMIEPLVKYVPQFETELNHECPEYLPTPVPLAPLFGSLGIGIGIQSKIPSFSFKSMLQAYEANDYNLLRPVGDVILYKRASNLRSIWEQGKGKVTYKLYVEEEQPHPEDPDIMGYGMYGEPDFYSTQLHFPISDKYNEGELVEEGWITKGYVEMYNISTDGDPRVYFGVSNKKKNPVTKEMLRTELEKVRTITNHFNMATYNRKMKIASELTGLRDWIKACYEDYNMLVARYIADNLQQLDFKAVVIDNSRRVAEYVMDNRKATVADICKAMQLPEEVVNAILQRRISSLLNINEEREHQKLQKDRNYFENLKPRDLYENLLK